MDTEIKRSIGKLERVIEKLGQEMRQGFNSVRQKFDGVDKKFNGINQEFKNVNQEFKNVRQEMKDGFKNVTGLIVFEVSHLKKQMDDRFAETDERFDVLYKHVDGFTNLHKTLDMELAATRLQQGRLEERVSILETKV